MHFPQFCKKHIGLLLILSMLIGYFVPQFGLLKPILPYLLILMLYNSLLPIEIKSEHFFQKKLLIFPLLNWIILPTIILFTSSIFPFEYRIGLIIMIITPTALGSPVITKLANGKIELAMSFLLIFNMIAPLTYPLLLWLFFSEIDISVPVLAILLRTAKIVFIPLLASFLTKKSTKLSKFIISRITPINPFLVILLVTIVISSARVQIDSDTPQNILILFAYILAICSVLYLTGYFIGRKNELLKRSLPIALGHKNTGLAILVCVSNFSAITAIPAVLYIISHHLLNAIIIHVSRKETSSH